MLCEEFHSTSTADASSLRNRNGKRHGRVEGYTWEVNYTQSLGGKDGSHEWNVWPGIVKDPIQECSLEGPKDLSQEKQEVSRKK